MKDWSKAGYVMRQQKGAQVIKSKLDPNQEIFKREFHIVTQELKSGDKQFRRFSWQLEKNSKLCLIQFETLSRNPVFHGNSKKANAKVTVDYCLLTVLQLENHPHLSGLFVPDIKPVVNVQLVKLEVAIGIRVLLLPGSHEPEDIFAKSNLPSSFKHTW